MTEADFRNNRKLLPPEAFAYAEGPDLPPSDIIEEKVWNSIMNLPDDVSLRTSADHGTELKFMHGFWSSILDSSGKVEDVMWHSVLDTADELMAGIVNSLIGFYRLAYSSLRSALETTLNGVYYQRCKTLQDFKKWRVNQEKIDFDLACSKLTKLDDVKSINNYLFSKIKTTLTEQKNSRYKGYQGGWARKLYSQLSNYVHSRPSYTIGELWLGSNGPIYIRQSFGRVCASYCDTLSLIYVLIKLARANFQLPSEAEYLFKFPNVLPSNVSLYSIKFLWKENSII
jgi:hypothetical protein